MTNPPIDGADAYGISLGQMLPLDSNPTAPCQCQRTTTDIRSRLTRLTHTAYRPLDGLDAARYAGMDVPWSGPAASYFRDRLEALATELVAARDQLDTVRRLITQE